MTSIKSTFDSNIQRARDLGTLHTAIDSLTTNALDTSDLLRSQIVMAVSSMDHYIHQLVKLGIVQIFTGQRPSTQSYSKLRINIRNFADGVPAGTEWLEEEVDGIHGHLAFQQPDKIADAVRLIFDQPLWPAVADHLGVCVGDVKLQLKLVVDRRNKIAHESDIDPTYPGQRWPISRATANDAVNVIDTVTNSIHALCASAS